MRISKKGEALGGAPGAEELSAVNAFAKTELRAEDVYCFSVLLCDNEVDRDFERFGEKTLEELRELFVGKTGIADHEWSSDRQKARIYRCELITDSARRTADGRPYVYLKAHAYMLRTQGNGELIAEIEGGIKKETSVGCSVSATVCSICGQELGAGTCTHVKGRSYNGRLCYGELTGAVDAYEWSFVAVPAQRGTGVVKKSARRGPDMEELRRLYERAELGDRYLSELRSEVLRLGLICDRGLGDTLAAALGRMEPEELLGFKKSFEERVSKMMPLPVQLSGRTRESKFSGQEYLV